MALHDQPEWRDRMRIRFDFNNAMADAIRVIEWATVKAVTTAISELERAGVTERPEVALADAGYWNEQHFDEVIANKHIRVLIPPDRGGRSEPRPGSAPAEGRKGRIQ